MDWRNRKYYLASFSFESYQMRINTMKMLGGKLTPYKYLPKQQDELFPRNTYQYIIGVDSVHSNVIEYELKKAERNDYFCRWIELKRNI